MKPDIVLIKNISIIVLKKYKNTRYNQKVPRVLLKCLTTSKNHDITGITVERKLSCGCGRKIIFVSLLKPIERSKHYDINFQITLNVLALFNKMIMINDADYYADESKLSNLHTSKYFVRN